MLTSNHIERDKSALNTNQTLGRKTVRALQMLATGLSVLLVLWTALQFGDFFYGSNINIGIWEKENKSRTHLPTLLQTFQMIGDRNKEESAKDRKKNIWR